MANVNLSLSDDYKRKLIQVGVQMASEGKPVTDWRGYINMSAVVRVLLDERQVAADGRKRGER